MVWLDVADCNHFAPKWIYWKYHCLHVFSSFFLSGLKILLYKILIIGQNSKKHKSAHLEFRFRSFSYIISHNSELIISILLSSAWWNWVDQMRFLRNGQFWSNPIRQILEWHRKRWIARQRGRGWDFECICVWHGFPSLWSLIPLGSED